MRLHFEKYFIHDLAKWSEKYRLKYNLIKYTCSRRVNLKFFAIFIYQLFEWIDTYIVTYEGIDDIHQLQKFVCWKFLKS